MGLITDHSDPPTPDAEAKAAAYIKEVCGLAPFPFKAEEAYLPDAITLLIESHKRQRAIVSEETDSRLRFTRRFWFIPWRWRLWLRGDR